MERSVFRYIWRHSRPQQLWIAAVIIASIPTYFLALTLPKAIVNGPITGGGDSPTLIDFGFPAIEWMGLPALTLVHDVEVSRVQHLIMLCAALLALVCVNGAFKFYINTYKGRLGERMLRRLRFDLIDRVLRFPLRYTRQIKPAEVSSMVKDEVEPLGGFIGEAFATPLFLGAQAMTALVFILLQNVWLGLVAVVIVALQTLIIPRLRRYLVELARQRQLAARRLAGRVGEIVESAREIRVNDGSHWERAEISRRLGHIFSIRYRFYRLKFFLKFLNNFLSQLTPFLFYLIGGYAAIRGQLDVGQLVAVISAYRDLPPPIKDLINWDQQRVDVEVKYHQVIEHFSPDELLPPERQPISYDPAPRLDAPITLRGIRIAQEDGDDLVRDLDLEIAPGEKLAILASDLRAGEALGEVIGRLASPKAGSVRVGREDLLTLPDAHAARRIGYVGGAVYLANQTAGQALLYGASNVPRRPPDDPADAYDLSEAERSGNSPLDANADWVDFKTLGVADRDAVDTRILEVLRTVGLYEAIFDLGLGARLIADEQPELAMKVVQARAVLRFWVEEEIHHELVEVFDPDAYCRSASVAANLAFGAAPSEAEREELLLAPAALGILEKAGVSKTIERIGAGVAKALTHMIDAARGDPTLAETLELVDAGEAEGIPALHEAYEAGRTDPAQRREIMRLALRYIEPRDRMKLLTGEDEATLLAARKELHRYLETEAGGVIAFYEIDDFTPGATILENILFGKVRAGVATARQQVRSVILELLADLDLNDHIVLAGLGREIGTGGRMLTAGQRQQLALARALLKRPDVLILNRAFDVLGPEREAELIGDLLTALEGSEPPVTVIATLATPAIARQFDRTVTIEQGVLASA